MERYKLYLGQLPEENQKHLRHSVKMVRGFLQAATSRLGGYESPNAETSTDNVIKTIQDLRQAIAISEAMIAELVEAHGLPEDAKLVPDEYRKDFREILARSAP